MPRWPVEPMRAVQATRPPRPAAGGAVFEPKWDGFRAVAWVGPGEARLQSRHGKDLTGYFPDIVRALVDAMPAKVVLDGELVSWDPVKGRTSFTQLQQRITAGRRRLAAEAVAHPAHFVVFDLLRDGHGRELLDLPLADRRRRLQRLFIGAPPQLTLCPQTSDEQTARSWFTDWMTSGIEGLMVKAVTGPYRPGTTGWTKVKSKLTAEYVIGGVTGSLTHPESVLLGRYDRRGRLRYLGQTHALRAAQRRELASLLTAMVFDGDGSGHPWPHLLPAAWTSDLGTREPLPYLQVEPTLVAEVETDIAVDGPLSALRHRCTHLRVRPDLHPQDVARI